MTDLFDYQPLPAVAPKPEASFDVVHCESLAGARAWLDQNGWQPRHGGGYERAGSGLAIIKSPSPPACHIRIERR